MNINWSRYPNFSEREFACKHTGECKMHPMILDILQSIRHTYGKPMFISSGYRSPLHPIEAQKDKPGEHTLGMAVDILCYGGKAIKLLKLAHEHDIRRIGLHQKGNVNGRFIHIGIADKFNLAFPEAIWTY